MAVKSKRITIIVPVLLLVLLLVAGGGWALWRWLNPVDDRDLIAARMDEICRIAAKEGQEGITVVLGKSTDLSKTAWEPVKVEFDEFNFRDTLARTEIVKLFSAVRQRISTLEVGFYDTEITLTGSDTASAKGSVVIDADGRRVFQEAGDIRMKWRKSPEDGQWYVEEVFVRPVLSHNFDRK